MKKLQEFLEKLMTPVASFVSRSKIISAMTAGFVSIMPVTLGTALVAILANLPFAAWQTLLESTGIYTAAQEFISLTMQLQGIYVVAAFAYNYTSAEGQKGAIGAAISTAIYISLMPTVSSESGTALLTGYLGSNGIFPAMLIGLFVPWLYCKMMGNKKLTIKLPDSVPSMVSSSISSTFVVIIIFTGAFLVKYLLTLTSFGNLFELISQVVAKPILSLGATPAAVIIMYTFANLLWFFGIHPSPILRCYTPIFTAVAVANIEAFVAGEPLPYLTFQIVAVCCYIGGAGNTLGLALDMFTAKSEKYKALRKVVLPTSLFNINEPLVFGIPMVCNPYYLVPMVLSAPLSGIVTVILCQFITVNYNPTISLPWVTPTFISYFMRGGLWLLLFWTICTALHALLYLPFFRADDNRILKEEQGASQKETQEA